MFTFDNEKEQQLYDRAVEKMKSNLNLSAADDSYHEIIKIMISIGVAAAVTVLYENGS